MIKKSTSYRLAPEIQKTVSFNGGASFIEGCVLLVQLLNASQLVQRLSLEYAQRSYPPISALSLVKGVALSRPDLTTYLEPKKAIDRMEYDRIITKISDIPPGLPADYRDAIESLIDSFGEIDDPNI